MKEEFMGRALALAKTAYNNGEVPVGAVIVKDGKIIGEGYNRREEKQNALSHAETEAINDACKNIKSWRLDGCDIYVTLEPCPMCAGAIINSRIRNVYIGTADKNGGAVGSITNLFEFPFPCRPAFFYGIKEKECADILSEFFGNLRF